MRIIITENQLKSLLTEQKGCDIFSDRVSAQDYDELLQGSTNPYLKNMVGSVVRMSVDEYYKRCAQLQGTSVEDQRRFTIKQTVDKLLHSIEQGNKLYLPYIDYVSRQQEGRHRVGAAEKYGCNVVEVAIFLKKGQSDPFNDNEENDEEYSNYALEDMLGKWGDIKRDENGESYIEYNFISDELKFRKLYSNYTGDDLVSKTMYNNFNDIEKEDSEFNHTDEFYVSKDIPVQFLNYLHSEIDKNVTEEEKQHIYEDDYDFNKIEDGYKLYSLKQDIIFIAGKFGKLKELSRYLDNMVSSLSSYIFYMTNKYFLTDTNQNYKVEFDHKNHKMRVYSEETFNNDPSGYKTGKDMFYNEGVIVSDGSPVDFRTNNDRITFPGKLVEKYIQEYKYL